MSDAVILIAEKVFFFSEKVSQRPDEAVVSYLEMKEQSSMKPWRVSTPS